MVVLLSRRRRGQVSEGPSKKPEDTDAKQQRLKAWTPVGGPKEYISTFLVTGAIFVGVGLMFSQRDAVVYREQYDGAGTPSERSGCRIQTADAGAVCNVTVEIKKKMREPVHVFYEVDNFFQNHRAYVQSMEWNQLHNREHLESKELKDDGCEKLYENSSRVLNPCGLVPNTLFNDVIELSEPGRLRLKEKKIAWRTDVKDVLKQPEGFEWSRYATEEADDDACFGNRSYLSNVKCAASTCAAYGLSKFGDECYGYVCRGSYYDERKCDSGERVVFHYDRVDKYQYLYHTFPQVISPLVGVNSEHFAVWLRTAALPRFRKLYGRVASTLDDGTRLVFRIENNWDVHAFDGKKFLVVATASGFENEVLAIAYIAVGSICLALGFFFFAVQYLFPRELGDLKYIPWLNHDVTPQ
ncbi:hypothetical protein CTAYLR_000216 [Chrysophaeum taylorii]|uniref:Uncharacterized protein n=1 Tax=Chrysophaeum taylorii TaxID=2483200 RepID=A0AAD7XJ34_9STRA|nr:hypothetical protein CTAYLR_000216 [Chrysophaeum taylorii]